MKSREPLFYVELDTLSVTNITNPDWTLKANKRYPVLDEDKIAQMFLIQYKGTAKAWWTQKRFKKVRFSPALRWRRL